jgi:hypothetical protein
MTAYIIMMVAIEDPMTLQAYGESWPFRSFARFFRTASPQRRVTTPIATVLAGALVALGLVVLPPTRKQRTSRSTRRP